MAGICSILKGLLRGAVIDFSIFKLHYKLTALLLILCSILVAWRQQFGTAIDCLARDDIPSTFINDYCYVHSTYSLKESWNKSVGVDIPYPGVDKYGPGATKVYHTYYQWVSLFLFLQAIMFCIPRYYWKYYEAGRIQRLLEGIRDTEVLAHRFILGYGGNRGYFYHFLFADFLNAVNVIGQIFLTNAFLGGGFLSYGLQVSMFSEWNWTTHYDPMISVFPKMAKCDFHNYGRTGDIQRHDVLCILPLNILNEKIYVLLWFWYLVLGVLSCLSLLCDIFFLISKRWQYKKLALSSSYSEKNAIRDVVVRCGVGDSFIIRLLQANMNPTHFRDFVLCVSQKWEQDRDRERSVSRYRDKRDIYDSDEAHV